MKNKIKIIPISLLPEKEMPPKKKSSLTRVQKRDGRIVKFDQRKIAIAIGKAMRAVGQKEKNFAQQLSDRVVEILEEKFDGFDIPTVEEIQDVVERVLIQADQAEVAKAYILYRDLHARLRSIQSLIDSNELMGKYLDQSDWRVKENSNMSYSLQGLNNHVASAISANYWLHKIYPPAVRDAHLSGDLHLHDLQQLSAYCCGWDLRDFLMKGIVGVPGKVESGPAAHLRTALTQLTNLFYTLQGEAAGAQAVSNFDTLLAPFIYYDKLTYKEVKQTLQEFVFNTNVPTRVGFQTPFTNITLDMFPTGTLSKEAVVIKGKPQNKTYGEFQKEIGWFNKAYAEVMLEGDARGRVFTFPIPTYNITKDFAWNDPEMELIWEMTRKYGIPYFSNFINSDMDPDDVRSMCCRLRLSNVELRKKGGGLFGANPLTGSVGVVTINMARLGYLSPSKKEFLARLERLMDLAKESLLIKREMVEKFTDSGLYPYSKVYLEGVKKRFGAYWQNHFCTIGLNGTNEACLNFLKKDISTPEGRAFALEVLDFMRKKIGDYQKETNTLFNLEATPAEGTSYRFARIDKEKYPEIIVANQKTYEEKGAAPYYTNSTHLPVGFTDDIFAALDHQDELQTKYTGGTVFHGFLGESLPDTKSVKNLVRKVASSYHLPYFTLTPTFSICPSHGYLTGEHHQCPKCEASCEVYSRIVGYLRPVAQWNAGKREEFFDRKTYSTPLANGN